MDLQIKLVKKFIKGFTLLEIIIILGIISVLFVVSTSVYSSFKTRENLEISTTGLVQAIRHAQANSQTGKSDSSWGVKIFPNNVVIFKGETYLTRDNSADQTLDFYGGVETSGLSEIVFTKIIGSTTNTGTITLTNNYGTKNILINEKGTLTY